MTSMMIIDSHNIWTPRGQTFRLKYTPHMSNPDCLPQGLRYRLFPIATGRISLAYRWRSRPFNSQGHFLWGILRPGLRPTGLLDL